MWGYIYKTTCLITGLIYVGQHAASVFEPNKYIGSGKIIKLLIKEYGRENFICELLDTAESPEELTELEAMWITKLDAYNEEVGYNISTTKVIYNLNTKKIIKDNIIISVLKTEVDQYLADGWKLYIWREYNKDKKAQSNHDWYMANWEAQQERSKIYRLEHKEELQVKSHEWYLKNKTAVDEKQKQYYKDHKEEILARQRGSLTTKKYKQEHKEEIAEYNKKYNKENRARRREQLRQWRAKKKLELNTETL